jgi:hypothetical protein
MSPDPPKTPEEWVEWFVRSPVENTQAFANFQGDHTERLDDQIRAAREGGTGQGKDR